MSEFLDQQTNVIARMRDHSRRWQEYDQQATLAGFEYYNAALRAPDYPGKADPSPYTEVLRCTAWTIGAVFAVLLFVWMGFWVASSWQPVDNVITFVQPKKNPRWVK